MTVTLILICCLVVVLFITLVNENRQQRRLVLNLSTRLDHQSELLTRLEASAKRPIILQAATIAQTTAGTPGTEPVAGPDATANSEAAPPEPQTAGAALPAPARRLPPNLPQPPKPGLFQRWLGPGGLWPTLAALLVFSLATGFLIWFSLSLGRFSPGLRLGVALLTGLISLTLGLLAWEKRPRLGLALESYGLGLIALTLTAAGAWFPSILGLFQARAALVVLGLFAAILAMKQNSPGLTVMTPTIFFALWSALNPNWSNLTLTSALAGFLYLSMNLFAGRSRLAARRMALIMALASFNLTMASFVLNSSPGPLWPWTTLCLAWTLEGFLLFRSGRQWLGALSLGLAAMAVTLIPDRFSGALLSQFFLSASILGGTLIYSATRPGRPETKTLLVFFGLALWLAGSLASVWGFAMAYSEPSFILNWLLIVWSLFSLGLWLAGRTAPELLTCGSMKNSPPLMLLAQALPLLPALILVLGFLWPFLEVGFTEWPGELNPVAWILWTLSQGLGLSQAQQRTHVAAWSNAFILTLALALSQAAPALINATPNFGQEMVRLAVILGILALCARPPRLALFQDLKLCRTAGLALSCLALWQGLALTLDPANRPGFFGFLPVLNLTNLAQAAALWLPVAFLRRLTAPERPQALNLLQAILFFIWLNVVLARALYHLTGVPYELGSLFSSPLFLSIFAVVWGGLGLWFAGRRRGQTPYPEKAERAEQF